MKSRTGVILRTAICEYLLRNLMIMFSFLVAVAMFLLPAVFHVRGVFCGGSLSSASYAVVFDI